MTQLEQLLALQDQLRELLEEQRKLLADIPMGRRASDKTRGDDE
jgi:hypothetical protein